MGEGNGFEEDTTKPALVPHPLNRATSTPGKELHNCCEACWRVLDGNPHNGGMDADKNYLCCYCGKGHGKLRSRVGGAGRFKEPPKHCKTGEKEKGPDELEEQLVATSKRLGELLSKKINAVPEDDKRMSDKKVKKVRVVDIVRKGEIILVPETMTTDQAIEALERKKKEENEVTKITEVIRTFPYDGAHAFAKVMEEKYGYVTQIPTPGFFGPQPPELRAVEIGPGQTVHVPWGAFSLPGIDGKLHTGMTAVNEQLYFVVIATVKKKFERHIKELAALTREYLKTGSIYRGKAIKIRFTNDEGHDLDPGSIQPRFLDLTGVDRKQLVFSTGVQRMVEHYFFTHILHRDAARQLGVPGKRGVLFEGLPGTGKTLTMMVGAKEATGKGITVVYSESANDFEKVVQFASQYAPAMVVCEDIDRVASGDRDIKIDRILNILDGIETKNTDLMVVLTSNNVNAIQQPLLRPGRIDVSIHFEPPDSKASEDLVRLYAGHLLPVGEPLAVVGNKLKGTIPAVIREVVERSKLSALFRSEGNIQNLQISGPDLELAADSIREQLALLNRTPAQMKTDLQLVGENIQSGLNALADAQRAKGNGSDHTPRPAPRTTGSV